jgi:hypothetical protein
MNRKQLAVLKFLGVALVVGALSDFTIYNILSFVDVYPSIELSNFARIIAIVTFFTMIHFNFNLSINILEKHTFKKISKYVYIFLGLVITTLIWLIFYLGPKEAILNLWHSAQSFFGLY